MLRVQGDLDFRSAPDVRQTLIRLMKRGNGHLVVDLAACSYVDSSGMLALVAAAEMAVSGGASLSVRGPSSELLKMLQLGHLGSLMNLPEEAPVRHRSFRLVDTGVGKWEVRRMVTPALARACSTIRRAVLEEAAATPLTGEDLADLELAVGEAFANAIRHGSPKGEEDAIRIRTLRGARAFVVEISDDGPGFDRATLPIPAPEEIREGGMGIFYMEALTDWTEFESGEGGTTVRLAKVYP